MYGIIDIGSNTIRMNIYKTEGNHPTLLMSKKNAAGLASYVSHKRLSEEGFERAVQVLSEFKLLLDEFKIQGFAFATAALRNLEDSTETVTALSRRTGLSIVLLPGEKEAELDFWGTTNSVPLNSGLLVDIGGASTELVVYHGRKIQKTFSMPLGSLNMYDQHVHHLLPNRSERKAIKQQVLQALNQDEEFPKGLYKNIFNICGVGGTIRAASRLNNDLFDLPPDNREIHAANVKKIIKLLENDIDDDLISTYTLEVLLRSAPDRVQTVLPGMIILQTIIRYFSIRTIQVSTSGIREGYLYAQILKGFPTPPLPDADKDSPAVSIEEPQEGERIDDAKEPR